MSRTARKDTIGVQKAAAKKAARALTRLKFGIEADKELNKIIPDIDDSVDEAMNNGTDWQPVVKALVDDLIKAIFGESL